MRVSRAFCTSFSDSLSRDEVASSRMRIGAFFNSALAIQMRCRSPPESRAHFAYGSVETLRHFHYEVVSICHFCRRNYVFFGPGYITVRNVVPESIIEEDGLLSHYADLCPQRRQCDLAGIDAVNENAPSLTS